MEVAMLNYASAVRLHGRMSGHYNSVVCFPPHEQGCYTATPSMTCFLTVLNGKLRWNTVSYFQRWTICTTLMIYASPVYLAESQGKHTRIRAITTVYLPPTTETWLLHQRAMLPCKVSNEISWNSDGRWRNDVLQHLYSVRHDLPWRRNTYLRNLISPWWIQCAHVIQAV